MRGSMTKKTILLDLDGVLNEYKGEYNPDIIPELRSGAISFLEKLSESYDLMLFSTREPQKVNIWLEENNIKHFFSEITDKKKPAYLNVDDRCVCFAGNYEQTLNDIRDFRVWWKKFR